MTDENAARPEQSQSDDWLGKVISGKFRIIRLLGRGGMGCVYEAENIKLGRRMALKRILPAHAANREIVCRFELEAKAAGGLLHENILAVMDFDQSEDGTPYLVMELLEGQSLSALLKRVPFLDSRRATDLVVQACRGLAKAHEAGIVHRDLKPANLFLCPRADGTELVKILDFGIAKLKGGEPDGDNPTRPGSLIGTPKYMAPEQARGDLAIDARADVYALGVILYEALSNTLPHPGANDAQVLYHLQTADPFPLSKHRPDLPAAVCAVVERAIASDPDHRIPSAQALEQALLDATRQPGAPLSAGVATRPAIDSDDADCARLGLSLSPVGTETHSPVQITKRTRSRKFELVAGCIFIGMLTLAAGWRLIARAPTATVPASTGDLVTDAARLTGSDERRDVPRVSNGDLSNPPGVRASAVVTPLAGGSARDETRFPAPPAASPAKAAGPRSGTPAQAQNKGSEVSTRTVLGQSEGRAKADADRPSPEQQKAATEASDQPHSSPIKPDPWGKNPFASDGTRSALPQ